MEIEKEPCYPIYDFYATWIEDKKGEVYASWSIALPENKFWNSTSFRKMYKTEPCNQELNKYLIDWWDKYRNNDKMKDKNISVPILKVELFEWETWCLTWFQHETFDVGQSDREALDSFRRFVDRKIILNKKSRFENGKDIYCLMGAEDRWRWCGAEPNGDSNSKSEPPCRCKFCKEQGVIRIGH
jgi:hypothetical protein